MQTRMAIVETNLGSVVSSIDSLRKSGENAFYFVMGTVVISFSIYDDCVERKTKEDVEAVEKRVMANIEAVEKRVMAEIKQTQGDVKKVNETVSEIKGSVDTLIQLLQDRKD
ncbi:Protein of unknown function [Pyronema omphalodes CBS 100304]|uniref:Uncharacterized protein n=1 Tax=Pyronema omphalodes (strain CBS 100304) TaxID=1076935 RepID=U4LA58_PYROM|nr:Protein of unknown function [Pyronema omphalodes CBS 100304]